MALEKTERQEGWKEGRKEGRKGGRKGGREEGRKEGRKGKESLQIFKEELTFVLLKLF